MIQEALGVVLLLLSCAQNALGADSEKPAARGVIGVLVLLVFYLWRKAGIARMERELILQQLREETKTLRMTLISQKELRDELCRLSDAISSALGQR